MNKYATSKFGRLITIPIDQPKHFNATHGLSKTKEYKTWARMKLRCYDKNSNGYKDYGGRGITMCDEWNKSFVEFYKYVGPAPSKNHSIDRIDNNGNYEPGNVRWATPYEQARNKRNNILLGYHGEARTLAEWCEKLGIPQKRTQNRITRGWPVSDAFELKNIAYKKRANVSRYQSDRRQSDQQ